MNLLKEYIRLIIKEQLEEDIDIQKLSPAMIGVYSLAQAMKRLFELYNVFVDRYKKSQSNPAARTV